MRGKFLRIFFMLIFSSAFLPGWSFSGIQNALMAVSPAGSGGIHFGYARGMYTHRLSGPEIYTWRINNGYKPEDVTGAGITEVKNKFGSLQQFNSFQAYAEFSGSGLDAEIGINVRRKTTSGVYMLAPGNNGAPVERTEKLKIKYNEIFLTVGHRFDALYLGLSLDIGMFGAFRKVNDEKWAPWFYRPKLLGSGYTGKNPVAGYSLIVAYDISVFTLRFQWQGAMMNAHLDSSTGKDSVLPVSTKLFPIGNASVGLLFHFAQ